MSDARCSAIKLFGRPIPQSDFELPPPHAKKVSGKAHDCLESKDHVKRCDVANLQINNPMLDISSILEPSEVISSRLNKNIEASQQKSSLDVKETQSKADKEVNTQEQEKMLKKPDIILPCPRCNSMETKFCYYNNYNVNQPRHFCKNCQRYWTAGGAMRNVAVGAGRRKNKLPGMQNPQITIPSDVIVAVSQLDTPDSAYHQVLPSRLPAPLKPLKENAAILNFGPEAPVRESMAHVLNVGEEKRTAETVYAKEIKEEPSSCASFISDQNETSHSNLVTPAHPLHCYVGPWGYPWGPGWNNIPCSSDVSIESGCTTSKPAAWIPPPMLCAPVIPLPSFWGCMMTSWPNGAWSAPWLGTLSESYSGCSSNISPALGKHSRDADLQGGEKSERSLWVPKTLRIDDPDEAVKSSIWATLGIKPEESFKQGGIFKAFQSNIPRKGDRLDAARAFRANPAALSRSPTFLESA